MDHNADTQVEYETSDLIRLRGSYKSASPEGIEHGAVLMAHGITSDREEEGFFTELANRLSKSGFSSLRFDFRGHGESGGCQEEMSISGEYKDLVASFAKLKQLSRSPAALIAASFGAVTGCRALREEIGFRSAVLINPVLDLKQTFLEPSLPWAKKSFTAAAIAESRTKGYLLLDGTFKIGTQLLNEMRTYFPFRDLSDAQVPVLTIHGDQDTYVSFDVAEKWGTPNRRSRFVPIVGAEHGFAIPADRDKVIALAVDWIRTHTK